jgi:hypothetical protein
MDSSTSKSLFRNEAFWISPTGKIIEVRSTHIREVIDNPELFGLELSKIKELYLTFNEPLGFEGKARDIIMKELILNRWIRIRWRPKKCSYTVQMIDDEVTKRNLEKWREGVEGEMVVVRLK